MSDASINSNLEEAFKNSDWSTICAALMPRFNDYLARRSKNVFECEQVNSLEHVFTVPASTMTRQALESRSSFR
jgi:hypothetical protein